jgi:ketosteroid isomerase-like protein
MRSIAAALTVAVALATPWPTAAQDSSPNPEAVVTRVLEELRKAELVLDTDALSSLLAFSFTVVDREGRVSGSFGYLEPQRRLRERGGVVKEVRFDMAMVHVYGASAVASYELHKTWVDQGARRRQDGWASDVFEKRDDGAWVLVHRHRP